VPITVHAVAVWAAGGAPLEPEDRIRWELLPRSAGDPQAGKEPAFVGFGPELEAAVPPGAYVLRAQAGNAVADTVVEVSDPGEMIELVLPVGRIVPRIRRLIDTDPDDAAGITYELFDTDGTAIERGYGEGVRFVASPGSYRVIAMIGEVHNAVAVELAAGETLVVDIGVGDGRIVPQVTMIEGGDKVTSGVWVEIVAAEPAMGENDRSVAVRSGLSEAFDLPAGHYRLTATLDATTSSVDVEVRPGETVAVPISLNAGQLLARAMSHDGGAEIAGSVAFTVAGKASPEQLLASAFGSPASFILPAGSYVLSLFIEAARVNSVDVQLGAGDRIDFDVPVATGRIVAHAKLAATGPEVQQGLSFLVTGPPETPGGNRILVARGYGPGAIIEAPAGRYLLHGWTRKELGTVPIEVLPNETVEVVLTANAGILSVSATGARAIEVWAIRDDAEMLYDWASADAFSFTVPAGRYRVRALDQVMKPTSERLTEVTAGMEIMLSLP
jgi:hypothetical protein